MRLKSDTYYMIDAETFDAYCNDCKKSFNIRPHEPMVQHLLNKLKEGPVYIQHNSRGGYRCPTWTIKTSRPERFTYYSSEDDATDAVRYGAEYLAKFNPIVKGEDKMETKQLQYIIRERTDERLRELMNERDEAMDAYVNKTVQGKRYLELMEQLKEVADVEASNPRSIVHFTEEQEEHLNAILKSYDDKMHQVKIRAQEASALLATCNTYEECKDLMTRYGYIKEV